MNQSFIHFQSSSYQLMSSYLHTKRVQFHAIDLSTSIWQHICDCRSMINDPVTSNFGIKWKTPGKCMRKVCLDGIIDWKLYLHSNLLFLSSSRCLSRGRESFRLTSRHYIIIMIRWKTILVRNAKTSNHFSCGYSALYRNNNHFRVTQTISLFLL